MHEELVRTIRKQCSDMDCGNCNTCVKLQAADAIEEMQEIIKKQHDLIMAFGGETGILRLKEYADKYWALLEKHRWIPTQKKLPTEMETVIVTDGKDVGFSFCVNDYGTLEFYSPWKITHWMPMPEPPKKGMKTENDL